MQRQLAEFANLHNLYRKGDRILVAVSGGIDSVVLGHLLAEQEIELGIAHCNFGLRGAESDDDELFVKNVAADLGVPFYSKKFETLSYAATCKLSIQEAARDLRYGYFSELCDEHGFDKVAIGHHANDQMETMLFHLIRGTGMAGLHGIRAVRGNIIRPLLFATRQEIQDYAKSNEIAYRDDSSNSSRKYMRNRIRQEVVPALEEIRPDVQKAFRKTAESIAEEEELFRALVRSLEGTIKSEGSEKQRVNFKKSAVMSFPHPHLLLYYLLDNKGFSRESMRDIVASEIGSEVRSETHKLHNDRDYWVLEELEEEDRTPELIIREPGQYRWKNWWIAVEEVNAPDVVFSSNPNVAFVQTDFPITVCCRKEGDRVQPLGMKGSKLVSDILIDAKVPNYKKNNVPVFRNQGEILWVGGLTVSEEHKVDRSSSQVLKLFMDSVVEEDGN